MSRGLISSFTLNPLARPAPPAGNRHRVAGDTGSDAKEAAVETSDLARLGALLDADKSSRIARSVAEVLGDELKNVLNLQGLRIPEKDLEGFVQETLLDVLGGRSAILHLKVAVVGAADMASSVSGLLDGLVRISGQLEAKRQEQAIEKLVEVFVPEPLEELRGVLAQDNLDLRLRFLQEIPTLTSAEVAKSAGHDSKNASATASRWKAKGEIFSVPFKGVDLYPAFQFRDGAPHPTVKAVLAALPPRSPWQIAFWFVSTNGWLDDEAPMDVLGDTAAVVEAARREAEEAIG